jgi:hypothetical protein
MADANAVNELVEKIEQTAPHVAEQYDEHQEAIQAERDAEAVILSKAIASAKPALKALSSRIVSDGYSTQKQNGFNPVYRSKHHLREEQGLVLVDGWSEEKDESGNRGTLGGARLYLLSDGRLAEVERIGSFSQRQGEATKYTTTLKIVDPRTAMDTWDLVDALKGLMEALEKQIGRKGATATAKARAERLAALAKLAN